MQFQSNVSTNQEVDPEFLDRIDHWVKLAAVEELPSDAFLKRLPGVWPCETLASLNRLERRHLLPPGYQSEIEGALCRPRISTRPVATLVRRIRPLEHPLDYEWLFTKEGQDVMLSELQQYTSNVSGEILCLGCPTLFELGRRLMPEQQFLLWDKNNFSEGDRSGGDPSLTKVDLRHDSPQTLTAKTAIVDPPWYDNYCHIFLWAALRNVRLGGTILLSFPPEGTRPSAARDLKAILAWMAEAGASLISHRRGCLPYCTPLFELNALTASGIPSVPLDWRRGDLLMFKKELPVQVIRPQLYELGASWEEYRFDCVRLKIRLDEEQPLLPTLQPVGKTDVLPSVSTRFPGRNLANVVTSGNRFFNFASPRRLADLCCELNSKVGVSYGPAAANSDLSGVQFQLERLVKREQCEATEYFTLIDGL